MSKTEPNQPAFASTDGKSFANDGLSKREYFAAIALQGLMVQAIAGRHNINNLLNNTERAKFAVDMADALIKALNEGGDNE